MRPRQGEMVGGGAEEGVSGRRRAEWEDDARDDGRDIGRRVGVSSRNGTPAASSLCLCMSSSTFSSIYRSYIHEATAE